MKIFKSKLTGREYTITKKVNGWTILRSINRESQVLTENMEFYEVVEKKNEINIPEKEKVATEVSCGQ